jgi:hypothetical protein
MSKSGFIGMCRENPVPKAFGIGQDESARNEIKILIAEMPRAVRGEHHFSKQIRINGCPE